MIKKKLFFKFSIFTIILVLSSALISYILLSGYTTVEAGSFSNIYEKDFYVSNEKDYIDVIAGDPNGDYFVYSENLLIGIFNTYEDAVEFAKPHKYCSIKQKGMTNLLWDNYPPYNVYTSAEDYYEFDDFDTACEFADSQNKAYVYFRETNSLVYEKKSAIDDSAFINNIQHIMQFPELPRGCEVTSLAMLINYKGIEIDKMTLAREITKNDEPYIKKNGKTYAGNPNAGFVGSMTSFDKFGLGVYHKPIYDLLLRYFPDSAIDITGSDFDNIYHYLLNDSPVWVIINSKYQRLGENEFEKWQTPSGEINITYREHSVLITGYDEKNIYFLDPLGYKSSAPKSSFIDAWKQMGQQAISIKY